MTIRLQKKQKAKDISLCVWKETEGLDTPPTGRPPTDPSGGVQLGHSGKCSSSLAQRLDSKPPCASPAPANTCAPPTSSLQQRVLDISQIYPLPQLKCQPSAGPALDKRPPLDLPVCVLVASSSPHSSLTGLFTSRLWSRCLTGSEFHSAYKGWTTSHRQPLLLDSRLSPRPPGPPATLASALSLLPWALHPLCPRTIHRPLPYLLQASS